MLKLQGIEAQLASASQIQAKTKLESEFKSNLISNLELSQARGQVERQAEPTPKSYTVFITDTPNTNPIRFGRRFKTLDAACRCAQLCNLYYAEVRDEAVPHPRCKIVAIYQRGQVKFKLELETKVKLEVELTSSPVPQTSAKVTRPTLTAPTQRETTTRPMLVPRRPGPRLASASALAALTRKVNAKYHRI